MLELPALPALLALLASDRTAPVVVDADGGLHDLRTIAATLAPIAAALQSKAEVVLACEDRLHFVHAALAAWATDAMVLLPPNLQRATIEQMMLRPHDVGLLHDGSQTLGIDISGLAPSDGGDLGRLEQPWDPARRLTRLFTSGSTGAPKPIDKTAGQLVGEASQLARTFGLSGARVLCTVPPHHIYGLLFGVLMPMVGNATIVAVSALHAEAVRAAIEQFGVDVLVSTPAQLRAFDVLDSGALRRLRHVFSSGAPLLADTAQMLRERLGVAPTEVFGSSETGGIATRTHEQPDPPWVPLPGVEVSADATGRMLLRSGWLDPMLPQPHATEDRIAIVGAGFVHRGRCDDVIKVGGRRVALGDVSTRLKAHPGITDAVAVALPTRDGRGQAIGVVVETATVGADEVRSALAPWFDAAVIPRRVVCVSALPRAATGKLSLASVLALLGGAPGDAE